MVGKRKPLLRSLLRGKDTHGRYRSGTPRKSMCASRPVPMLVRVSRVMSLAFSCQAVSFAGQVVKVTPLRSSTPWGVRVMSCAVPRALRCARLNCAWRNAGAGGRVVTAAGPGDVHQRIAVVDVLIGVHRALRAVVLHLLGADLPIALGRHHVAVQCALAVDPHRRGVTGDVDRATRGGARGRRGRRRPRRRDAQIQLRRARRLGAPGRRR